MKRMLLSTLNGKERNAAFQEAQLLQQLSHPNIVAYVDTLASKTKLYLFMQYCDSGDLEGRLEQSKKEGQMIAKPQALDWFVQMSLALQYLHQRRVLHRDLKTANVFLTAKGCGRLIVKLGDFGVSRVLSATAELAKTFVGTPYYLSPELLMNQPYGRESDVWALGCIFYEVTTLEHPFEAANFPSLAHKILNDDPPLITTTRPDCDVEMDALMLWMLTKEPSRRASLAELLGSQARRGADMCEGGALCERTPCGGDALWRRVSELWSAWRTREAERKRIPPAMDTHALRMLLGGRAVGPARCE